MSNTVHKTQSKQVESTEQPVDSFDEQLIRVVDERMARNRIGEILDDLMDMFQVHKKARPDDKVIKKMITWVYKSYKEDISFSEIEEAFRMTYCDMFSNIDRTKWYGIKLENVMEVLNAYVSYKTTTQLKRKLDVKVAEPEVSEEEKLRWRKAVIMDIIEEFEAYCSTGKGLHEISYYMYYDILKEAGLADDAIETAAALKANGQFDEELVNARTRRVNSVGMQHLIIHLHSKENKEAYMLKIMKSNAVPLLFEKFKSEGIDLREKLLPGLK